MRNHEQIVRDAGAPGLAERLAEVGIQISQTTPLRWRDRNSIPAEYWPGLVLLEVATIAELAAGAKRRRRGAMKDAA